MNQQANFFRNLSIRKKMFSCFGLMILITLIISLIAISSIKSVGASGKDAGLKYAPLVDAAMEIKLSATRAHLLFEEIMAGDDSEDINEVWALLIISSNK
jgi:hypothetical protein